MKQGPRSVDFYHALASTGDRDLSPREMRRRLSGMGELLLSHVAGQGAGDTHIAAIYHLAGVKRILTSNVRDFGVVGCLEAVIL